MIEKKCKICGDWINSKKIAMHYWNIHHKKYNEYKYNEETREVEDPVAPVEPKPEVKIVKEGETNEKETSTATQTTKTNEEPIVIEVQEPVVEIPTPIFETETVDNGLVETPPAPEIPNADMWKETAKYFEDKETNEAKNELRQVNSVYRDSETINEWCN